MKVKSTYVVVPGMGEDNVVREGKTEVEVFENGQGHRVRIHTANSYKEFDRDELAQAIVSDAPEGYPWRTAPGGPSRAVEEVLVRFKIAGMFGGGELLEFDQRWEEDER